jgi:hypothetical protein
MQSGDPCTANMECCTKSCDIAGTQTCN